MQAYPAWYNYVGAGRRDGAIPGFAPPSPAGNFPGFLGGQRLNPRPPAARPDPKAVPAEQQALQGFVDPGHDYQSLLNPFIQGGGDSTAAYPGTGNSEYGLMFQTNGEPLPLYPAPRPTEILPTRLIFPGPLGPLGSRLQPVPGNPIIFNANKAWYDSLAIGDTPVAGVHGVGAAAPIPAVPGAFNSFAPLYPPYLAWEIQNVMWLGVWVNLSAYFEKAASIQVSGSIELGTEGMQFAAIEGNTGFLDREQNSPYPTQARANPIYTCICIYINICTHARTHLHICMYTYMYINVYTYICIPRRGKYVQCIMECFSAVE